MAGKKEKMTVAQIMSDRDTVEKLRQRSGGKPVAKYLREIANEGPPPESEISTRLDSIERMIHGIYEMLEVALSTLSLSESTSKTYDMLLDEKQKRDMDLQELEELRQEVVGIVGDKIHRLDILSIEALKEIKENPSLLDDQEWVEGKNMEDFRDRYKDMEYPKKEVDNEA